MNREKSLCRHMAIGCLFVAALLGWSLQRPGAAGATETRVPVQDPPPVVEVMFVLDTTGSMGGLIAAAKDRIWSIANTLASADPAPEIRMGLVGYRDRGDAYVTTFTALTNDLDAVYTRLMQFDANGGGDTPESVNQALHDAVTKPRWNTRKSAYRVIFLVGDAPPQMNYGDDVPFRRSCRLAAEKDIIINTIQCGNLAATRDPWRQIARMGNGRYFQVAQSGNAVMYDTPFDDRISGLSHKLDATRVYYGNARQLREMATRQAEADRIYSEAKPSAVAKRTIFNAKKSGARNFAGSNELVQAVTSGDIALAAVPKDQLPPELQSMSEAELEDHIDDLASTRRALRAQITELAKQRQDYIERKVNAASTPGETSLDATIYQCIQTQAREKGIHYTQGPEY